MAALIVILSKDSVLQHSCMRMLSLWQRSPQDLKFQKNYDESSVLQLLQMQLLGVTRAEWDVTFFACVKLLISNWQFCSEHIT